MTLPSRSQSVAQRRIKLPPRSTPPGMTRGHTHQNPGRLAPWAALPRNALASKVASGTLSQFATPPPTAYEQGAVETRLSAHCHSLSQHAPLRRSLVQFLTRTGDDASPQQLTCTSLRTDHRMPRQSPKTTGSRSGLRHQLNSRQLGSGWVGFLKILAKVLLAEAQGLSVLKPLSQHVKGERVH